MYKVNVTLTYLLHISSNKETEAILKDGRASTQRVAIIHPSLSVKTSADFLSAMTDT